jgi:hypothetical protein
MSTLAERIGQALARAKLAQVRAMGGTVSFSHRGAAAVTLYAEITESAHALELSRAGHSVTEERILRLVVPTDQPGFAAPTNGLEPVTPGDKVVHRGRTYFVCPPVRTEAYGQIYRLRCSERRRLASNVP